MSSMNSIFDIVHLIAQNVWLYGGAFVIVLSVLVFVHEFGHYYVARRCGVRIESFSIGFGKELFGFTDRHGTRWKFSLIPLGGYVKMFGDTDPASAGHTGEVVEEGRDHARPMTDTERKVAFYTQPVGKRAAIVFAGPAINFLFAIVILAALYMTYGQPVTPPIGSAIIAGSAADEAGFQPHDKVLAIDGKPITRFEDIRREVTVGLDQRRIFTVERNGEILEIAATPKKLSETDHFGFRQSRGLLGLISPGNAIDISRIVTIEGENIEDPAAKRERLAGLLGRSFEISLKGAEEGKTDTLIVNPGVDRNRDITTEGAETFGKLVVAQETDQILMRHKPLQALFEAVDETKNITIGTLQALGQMFTGTRSATELGGIIRIGAIAGDMAKAGLIALVTFTALLSINLGLINLFPIPMLDGGHLLFYALETLKGAPIAERVQEYAFRFGLALLVGIMLFANLNDIWQLTLKFMGV